MITLKPDKDILVRKVKIGSVPTLILSPKASREPAPGVLWIHGGGYILGILAVDVEQRRDFHRTAVGSLGGVVDHLVANLFTYE